MAVFDTKIEGCVSQARNFLERYISKGEVVEIRKKDCERTPSQNRYLHYILSFFADETGYSLDEVKVTFFKRTCNCDIFVRSHTNKRGKDVEYLRSTSELTKEEMSLAISRFRNWSSMPPVGIYIPSPEDKDFVRYCESRLNDIHQYDNL